LKIQKIKAVALISSGLDSLLSAVLIKRFGIEVTGLHCFFRFDPFLDEDRVRRIRELFRLHNIPIVVKDITDDFLKIFLDPVHGYGSEMNPCIDCRLLTLQCGKILMEEIKAKFLITGEVVGQRPMTQNKPTLFHIDKVSGLKGLILRPLSATILPPTVPEEEGWVDREELYGFSGRSRKPQIELASRLGIEDYSQPAGGCLLTDPEWARRAKMLMKNRGVSEISVDSIRLLRLGRQFWPNNHLWVVVGRNERDNVMLESFADGRWIFEPDQIEGPTAIAENVMDETDRKIVSGIVARYCSKCRSDEVSIHYKGSEEGVCSVQKMTEPMLEMWRV
jgi:tRNA-specific 2-thiouridylase